MNNKLYLRGFNKEGFGEAVKPEMDSPDFILPANTSEREWDKWYEYVDSLPPTLVNPEYAKKIGVNNFFSDWEEGYEFLSIPDAEQSWLQCTKPEYDFTDHKYRRIVLIKKKSVSISTMNRKMERMTGVFNSRQENEYHLPLKKPLSEVKEYILDKITKRVWDKSECDESMLIGFPDRYIAVKLSDKILQPQPSEVKEKSGEAKDWIKKYYDFDENEFEPQVSFINLSFSDIEQLINDWEARPEHQPPEVEQAAKEYANERYRKNKDGIRKEDKTILLLDFYDCFKAGASWKSNQTLHSLLTALKKYDKETGEKGKVSYAINLVQQYLDGKEERRFTLDEMKDCFCSAFMQRGYGKKKINEYRAHYFKSKFNIDISEQK